MSASLPVTDPNPPRLPEAAPAGARSVLLALHYQNEVLHETGGLLVAAGDRAWRERVIVTADRLLSGARSAALPIVSVRIEFRPGHRGLSPNAPIFRHAIERGVVEQGSFGAEFFAGLGPKPEEIVVTHGRINAFFGSDLESMLRADGVERLIVAGIATSSVVLHTVMHAVDLGFEVTVARDACAAADRPAHEAALRNLAPLARLAMAEEILAELGELAPE